MGTCLAKALRQLSRKCLWCAEDLRDWSKTDRDWVRFSLPRVLQRRQAGRNRCINPQVNQCLDRIYSFLCTYVGITVWWHLKVLTEPTTEELELLDSLSNSESFPTHLSVGLFYLYMLLTVFRVRFLTYYISWCSSELVLIPQQSWQFFISSSLLEGNCYPFSLVPKCHTKMVTLREKISQDMDGIAEEEARRHLLLIGFCGFLKLSAIQNERKQQG